MEGNVHLNVVDVIVNDLQENLCTENDEFYEQWRRTNIEYQEGDTLTESIHKLRHVHDVPDENILEFLLQTTERLNVHIDSGATKVAVKIGECKLKIERELRSIKEQQYEQQHFTGRDEEIKKMMDCFQADSDYIGICVCGLGGNGKTVLADYVCTKLRKTNWSCRKVVAREVKTVSQLIRCILKALERTDNLGNNKKELQNTLLNCISTDTRLQENNIIFLDNIDDIDDEWDDLINFLEKLMTSIYNNSSIKTKILITSRRKLLTTRGIEYVVNSLLRRQQSVGRFHDLCLEIELKSLSYDSASQLVRSIFPKDLQSKISADDIKKLIMSCGHNPLLIHTMCDTLKRGDKDISDILRNVWSVLTPVTGHTPDACIEQTFLQLKKESQELLIQLAVFKTSQFDLDSCHPDRTMTQTMRVNFSRLKMYHLIESNDSDGQTFSIHPMVYNFLKTKVRDQQGEFGRLYQKAVIDFIDRTLEKMGKFDSIRQTSLGRVHNLFVCNEAQFQVLLEHIEEHPSNGSRTIRQNKIISETADLIISDKKKIEMMKKLQDKAEDEGQKLIAYFWKIEILEAHLDNDDKGGLEKLDSLGKCLQKIAPQHSASALMPVYSMLMYLKGKWFFRFDKYDEGFQALYPALCILHTDFQSDQLRFDASKKWPKEFKTLRSNIFNLMGCLYLRENGAKDNIAIHCFIEAFHSMVCHARKSFPVRSSNMALFISNIGACIYYKAEETLKDDTEDRQNRVEIARALLVEALKWSEVAITLRRKMGQEKYSTFAFELQKRGKCYLVLQQVMFELNQLNNDMNLFYRALEDFKSALEIHLRIEKFPHSNITLVLHLIAKTGVLIGKKQLECELTDAGDVGLRYSKMLYDSLAQVIYDNGLQGYDKELLDIKDNHTWLLKHFKDGKLKYFETVYKVCQEGKRAPIWKRNSIKITKVEDRLKDLEKVINKDELFKIMDVKTGENVKQLISRVESKPDSFSADELSILLPVTIPDVADDSFTSGDNKDEFFDMIDKESRNLSHFEKINNMMGVLIEKGQCSTDFDLALKCLESCMKECCSIQPPESFERKEASTRKRIHSTPV